MRHEWDSDREEIEVRWKNIGLFRRLIILFMFPFLGRSDDITYIFDRLFTRQDRMVRYKELHWESIYNFLWRKL